MAYEINYYRTERGDMPVKEFIDSLPAKLKAKNMRELELLEQFGPTPEMPDKHAQPLHGKQYRGLWELRVKFSNDITRVFYFYPRDKEILLLHGFVKKSDATPTKELETAKRRMDDAIKRRL